MSTAVTRLWSHRLWLCAGPGTTQPQDTHLLGKTRVMPPSVAAKTAKRLYLQGKGPGMVGISGALPLSPQPVPTPRCSQTAFPVLGHLDSTYVLRSWSFQTRSTSCCVMPVSRIRL